MEQSSSTTALASDLGAVYGPKTEHAAGMTRATWRELRGYFAAKLEEIDRIGVCANCEHHDPRLTGRECKQFGPIPETFDGRDCEIWQWDGVPW